MGGSDYQENYGSKVIEKIKSVGSCKTEERKKKKYKIGKLSFCSKGWNKNAALVSTILVQRFQRSDVKCL